MVLVCIVLAGCTDMLERDVGGVQVRACRADDSDPAHEVSFADDVQPILAAHHCASCHTPGGATPIGISIGGLDLSSYRTLRIGGARSGSDIVVPSSPCASVLVQKVSAGPPFGARMPLDGPPYVEQVELAVITDWIAEGARDN